MPDTALQRALEESTAEVLERMFFIQCETLPLEALPDPEVVVHLVFEGDPSGALVLGVSTGAARSVAADFLALEETDLSDQQVGDVICELANMICGSVLSRVESASTFRLRAPRIVASRDAATDLAGVAAGAAPSDARAGCSTVHAVEIGNGRMVVSIITETPAWSKTAKHAF